MIRLVFMEKLLSPVGKDSAGFTLVETLLATVIFSVALVALASISITVVGGNRNSKHFVEASVLAQSQLESLRYTGFDMGPDGSLGTSDDDIPSNLTNPSTGNDATTDAAALFSNPDHAYTLSGTAETTPILDSPSLTPTATILRRTWTVRDNVPAVGMKTVTVVIGWLEGSSERYVAVSTAIQGI